MNQGHLGSEKPNKGFYNRISIHMYELNNMQRIPSPGKTCEEDERAELAKAKFIDKMDKAYFSIMNLKDIIEQTEDLEASMPSEMEQPIIGEEVCQPASKVAVERRAGWLCQPATKVAVVCRANDIGGEDDDDDFGVAVVRDLEASMPEMLSDMNVGVHDAVSYAEVPPTGMKTKVKKFGQDDDAEMSPSVEVTKNVQVRQDAAEMSLSVENKVTKFVRVRPDDAEMGLSVEIPSEIIFTKVQQEAELRPSVEMNVKTRECSESGPPPTRNPAQEYPKIHLQSMTPIVEKSCCCRSNSDWPNRPVGGELRYLCTSVHRGTTLCNMELCSRLKKHMKVITEPSPPPNSQCPTQKNHQNTTTNSATCPGY